MYKAGLEFCTRDCSVLDITYYNKNVMEMENEWMKSQVYNIGSNCINCIPVD